jgi:hypothetical protein
MLPRSRAGLAGAVAHLLVLGLLVTLIVHGGDPGWPKYWTIMLALDFPVSLGIVPVTWLAPPSALGPLSDVANFWWPLAWHGVIGTIWWYIVGWAIARKISRALAARGSNGEENG